MAAIRRKQISVPIIVLTARDTVADRVEGLDAGADDYLVKPFAFAELLARIRVLLRRGRLPAPRHLTVGPLALDVVMRKVVRDGQSIEVTAREFELLEFLMRFDGQVVSRETLAREVWKESGRTAPLDDLFRLTNPCRGRCGRRLPQLQSLWSDGCLRTYERSDASRQR